MNIEVLIKYFYGVKKPKREKKILAVNCLRQKNIYILHGGDEEKLLIFRELKVVK